MVKISDIAREANVSITTVSRALNNYADINERTKERVLKIACELGYFPNANAKGLKTNNNWLVGILFTESLNVGLEHPLFAGVIESFKSTIGNYGYDTIFITSKIGGRKMGYLQHCRHRNVNGVFVCTYAGWDSNLKELLESDIKCVTTDVEYNQNVPIILSDNVDGTKQAYEYLYKLGHRRIACLAGNQNTLSGRERLRGYKLSIEEHRENYRPEYVIYTFDYDFNSGYKAMEQLFENCTEDDMPSAVIAVSDTVAIGAISFLESRGIRVPEDISIIGFDDIELVKYYTPRLTTIRQDRAKIGEVIAETLVAYINGMEVPARTLIPVSLVERDTCRPIS
jgi:LacI family transcriptional regulator